MDTILRHAWAIPALGLVFDLLGFFILMTELYAAQRTEFRTYHHDLVSGIDELRIELRRFVDGLHAKLKKLVPTGGNPYQALRELLDIYFAPEVSRTAFDAFIVRHRISLNDDDDIGLLEHINLALATKDASQAVSSLERDRVREGLSDIERKWFSDWYPLPGFEKGAALRWYEGEMWGGKKPRWLSDNSVFFRAMEYRKQALLKRRALFYVGAALVVIGFVLQFFGTMAQQFADPASVAVRSALQVVAVSPPATEAHRWAVRTEQK